MSTPELSGPASGFDRVIAPLLFANADASSHPRLQLVLSASASGRSRAVGRIEGAGVVVNARDLAVLAVGTGAATVADATRVAAEWLQRALAVAREGRVNVTLEGAFRSPALVVGVSALFADSGYQTHVATVAERVTEVRMADASRRFDVELRLRRTDVPVPTGSAEGVAPVLAAIVNSRAVDRVRVFDRDGITVVDADRDDSTYVSTPAAFAEAVAQPLGTLRSAAWLSELRHMTRFLAQQGPAPRWAVDELIALHHLALTDIVPELPIPADSDTRRVQEARLLATLTVLRNSVTSADAEDPTAPVRLPQVDGVTIGR